MTLTGFPCHPGLGRGARGDLPVQVDEYSGKRLRVLGGVGRPGRRCLRSQCQPGRGTGKWTGSTCACPGREASCTHYPQPNPSKSYESALHRPVPWTNFPGRGDTILSVWRRTEANPAQSRARILTGLTQRDLDPRSTCVKVNGKAVCPRRQLTIKVEEIARPRS